MTISPVEKELEDQLAEAGNRLLSPPSSVDELLRLLDKVETFLAKVEQSPSKSMHSALSPSMDALVRDELLRHADLDVKVAVAACISEITRITAPEAPYDDDQMKEVFQLIVSSFEKLYDKSSRSYNKRTSILETVAKVRSCVVMLDLECDALIVEMFKHFLQTIRDDHAEHVFSCMETIMSLVLEESEDIPTDLLSTILDCLKKANKEVLPIAQKLGVRVLEKCSSKLKPYLVEAVKSEGGSLFDYTKVVADVCGDTFDAAQPSQADESKPIKPDIEGPLEEPITEDVPPADEVAPAQAAVGSLKTVMSNGTLKKEKDEPVAAEDSSKEPKTENHTDNKITAVSSSTKTDGADSALAAKSQTKAGKTNKRKGRKGISIKNSSEPSESAPMDVDKEAEKPLDHQEVESKDIGKFPCQDSTAEVAAAPTEKEEKETTGGVVPPKTPEDKAVDGEGQTNDASKPKEDENLKEETTTSVDTDSKKLPEENAVSDTKSHKRANIKASSSTGVEGSTSPTDVEPPKTAEDTTALESKAYEHTVEKAASSHEDKERTPLVDPDSKKEPNAVNAYGIRTGKRTAKKRRLYGDEESSEGPEVSKKDDEVTSDTDRRTKQSAKKAADKKKKGQGRESAGKNRGKAPAKEEGKKPASISTVKESASKKTPKTDNKRKRGEEESSSKLKDENLVGRRIRVLWPEDKEYYTGVISSFDAVGKRHKVNYDDGDVEILKLTEEKWELLNEETAVDTVDASVDESLENSSDLHAKKRAKTGSASSKKRGKASASSKKSGGASSSKSKAAQPKSGSSKGKSDVKSASKPQDVKEVKSKDTPKSSIRLKEDDTDSPKATGSKSKQETPKTVSKSKGKASKSGVKSDNTNGAGSKVKSGGISSAKDAKKAPEAAAKTLESTKGKSPPSSSKPQTSGSKTSKKRSRR